MQKSLLEVYLTRVSAGDLSYMDRLCAQLTDRLCYLPVLTVARDSGTERVEALRFDINGIPFVPLFTSEKKLDSWLSKHTECSDSIEVLGGDLCAVLGADSGVLIDPEAEVSVRLPPDAVAKIACEVLFNNEPTEEEIAAPPLEEIEEPISAPDTYTTPLQQFDEEEEELTGGYQPAPRSKIDEFDPFGFTPTSDEPEQAPREETVKIQDPDEVSSTMVVEAPHEEPPAKRGPLTERDTQTIYPNQPVPPTPPSNSPSGGPKRSIMGLFKTKQR